MLVNQAAMVILSSPSDPMPGIELYQALRDRLLHADPSHEWSEILIGESCFASGDFAAAEVAYRRAAQIATSPKPLRSAADRSAVVSRNTYADAQDALAEYLAEVRLYGKRTDLKTTTRFPDKNILSLLLQPHTLGASLRA
jgi:hypothetical protein